jgi:DNA-binding response OmpR family regulator
MCRCRKLLQVSAQPAHIVKSIPKRLLFVDDEPNIRATLPIILRRYGFTVTVAGTVQQALKHIQEKQFDLLLCDLNIEEESDGLKVIRAMRQANPSCVNIILTAFPALETALEGIHLNIDDYITKPTNADALVAVLAEKLTARQRKPRILTISNDEDALQTWRLLLEGKGYEVVSSGAAAALEQCKAGSFDILILGRSVSDLEKKTLIDATRHFRPVPVISIPAAHEMPPADGVDYYSELDPEQALQRIADLVKRKSAINSAAS